MTQGMPSGYSSRGGQVKSPYVLEENPSGSSSGSAVAAAANLCAAAIGTDTCNSIISPGLKNGLAGFRPSTGAISTKGIIPISFSLDTAGVMTRTVSDAAVLFSELTNTQLKTSNFMDLNGVTVGINEWGKDGMTEDEIRKIEDILRELEKAGASFKRLDIPASKYVLPLMKYEFKYALNQYLSELPEEFSIRTLRDIIEFNKKNEDITLRYGQTLLVDAEENTVGDLSETEYKNLLYDRFLVSRNLRSELHNTDVCIMLTDNNIHHYTGLPSISIPCGLYRNGMPFGIVLTAKTDVELLRYAHAISMIIGQRVGPILGK
jgi:amidase